LARTVAAQQLPELTEPVNDFAKVVDPQNAEAIDRMSRALQAKTGDAVVVATVNSYEPYADINEYAVKLFENHGKGIGSKDKDNGVLIVLAMKERKIKIEVGYGLEEYIPDGFAGETRNAMTPLFRQGHFGDGLRVGAERLIGRIAQRRGVTLDGVPVPAESRARGGGTPLGFGVILLVFFAILIISRIGGGPGRRRRYWGGGPWSGWSSGVGPFGGWGGGGFGGGFGGGGGGGGFGGGFGGFGGGSSGGGGASGSW
jgi:uncharacterized protein